MLCIAPPQSLRNTQPAGEPGTGRARLEWATALTQDSGDRKATAVCCDVSTTLAGHHPEYLRCIGSHTELFISNSEAMMQNPMKLGTCKDYQDFLDFSLLNF